jgi:hypothetical protein
VALLFEFVQFEFTHALGPPAGRYIVESDGARAADEPVAGRPVVTGTTRGVGEADVLVIGVVPAPASRPRLRRRARHAPVEPMPAEVPLLLATFIAGSAPIASEQEARAALDGVRESAERQELWIEEGLRVLNIAIRAYRAGAHDPYAIEVGRRDARRVRIGFGTAEDVQNGRWREALEPAPAVRERSGRIERLRPSEAVATVLSGRGRVLEGEDVMLRALVDLDHGRTRAAAFQVRAAMTLLADELGKPSELAELCERADALAAAAVTGPLAEDRVGELERLIGAADDVVDAWRYDAAE